MALKGIIFDMDGVIVDNSDMHRWCFKEMIKRYNGSVPFSETYFARRNEEIFKSLLPSACETIGWEDLSKEKEQLYRDTFGPVIKPMPGLLGFLEACRKAGLKCAVGSSAPRENVVFHLDKCGIGEYISSWMCMEDVKVGKPDPFMYLQCCSRLGYDPSECIVFEDATAGIEAGKRAGCKVVALTTSSPADFLRENTESDMIVKDFTEVDIPKLEKLLEK